MCFEHEHALEGILAHAHLAQTLSICWIGRCACGEKLAIQVKRYAAMIGHLHEIAPDGRVPPWWWQIPPRGCRPTCGPLSRASRTFPTNELHDIRARLNDVVVDCAIDVTSLAVAVSGVRNEAWRLRDAPIAIARALVDHLIAETAAAAKWQRAIGRIVGSPDRCKGVVSIPVEDFHIMLVAIGP